MWVDDFSLRLDAPLGTAAGEITERRGFLVGIDADSPGIGEATPLPGWTESYEACREALTDTAGAVSGGSTVAAERPDPGPTPAAAHAVELARLDTAARRTHRPLARLLRESAFDTDRPLPDSVPVNATVGDGDIQETVEAALAAVAEGFEWLKLKVGVREPQADRSRVQAVREAVGENVSLRLDANGAWDRATARRMIDGLAGLGIEYLEQPLPATDLDGLAALRGHGVEIAVDESLAERSVSAVIDAGAADVVVIKPMAVGGPLQAVEAAATARTAGVEPVVTTTVDGVVARTAAAHVAAAIPEVTACGLATGSLLAADLAADPISIADGRATLPAAHGQPAHGLCGDCFTELRPENVE